MEIIKYCTRDECKAYITPKVYEESTKILHATFFALRDLLFDSIPEKWDTLSTEDRHKILENIREGTNKDLFLNYYRNYSLVRSKSALSGRIIIAKTLFRQMLPRLQAMNYEEITDLLKTDYANLITDEIRRRLENNPYISVISYDSSSIRGLSGFRCNSLCWKSR